MLITLYMLQQLFSPSAGLSIKMQGPEPPGKYQAGTICIIM